MAKNFKKHSVRAKVHHITSRLFDDTGKPLITLDKVNSVLLEKKGMYENMAFIIHDRDILTADDIAIHKEMCERYKKVTYQKLCREVGLEEIPSEVKDQSQKLLYGFPYTEGLAVQAESLSKERFPELKVGDLKPQHIHIIIKFSAPREVDQISNWFGLSSAFDEIKVGKTAWTNAVLYLIHANAPLKAQYQINEVVASWDYSTDVKSLLAREEALAKRFLSPADLSDAITDVAENGLTIDDFCQKYSSYTYISNKKKIDDARTYYLRHIEMPSYRLNIYVEGAGGMGKDTLCRCLAQSFFPELDFDDCCYSVGAKNVALDKYDGQPVIIWSDQRAASLLNTFSRDVLFNEIFANNPAGSEQNKKYGSVRLINKINIINGIEKYSVFLDGLAGEYTDSRTGTEFKAEDKSQSYRRFPIILCVEETKTNMLINRGVAEGTRAYDQFIAYEGIRGSFKRLGDMAQGAAQHSIGIRMLQPATEKSCEFIANSQGRISKMEDMDDDTLDYILCQDSDTLQAEADASAECVPEPLASEPNSELAFDDYPIVPD